MLVVTAAAGSLAGADSAVAAPVALQVEAASGCGTGTTVQSPTTPGTQPSAAQLGLSPRSTIYQKAVEQNVRWLRTITCEQTDTQNVHTLTTETDPKWSGYEARYTSYAVSAEWTIPSVSNNGLDPAYLALWAGLGGDSSAPGGAGELIQAGTEQFSGPGGGSSLYFWYQATPGQGLQPISNPIPYVGDDVSVAVGDDWNANVAHFTICDYTRNYCGNLQESASDAGHSAEVIAERPGVDCYHGSCAVPDLADFGSVRFTNCSYDLFPFNQSVVRIVMTNSSTGHTLAHPGVWNSGKTAFTDYWQNYA